MSHCIHRCGCLWQDPPYQSSLQHSDLDALTVFATCVLEVCGYSIFATRPVPVAQDRYPYPYPTRTQNHYPTRPVPAGIPVPVTVELSQVPMNRLYSYQADRADRLV